MREMKIFTCALAIGSVIAMHGVNAAEGDPVPVACSGDDLLINNEFCIQRTANGSTDFLVASATSLFPHPNTEDFADYKVAASLCDGEKMIKAFRYTYDETQGEDSSMFPLFTRYWINDSLAFMNHFPVGIVRNAGGSDEDSDWAQSLSFDTIEIEDSESLEIWPMNRMKRTFEEFPSFKCYNPTQYGVYPASSN